MSEAHTMACAQCRYFQFVDAINGSCRRYPPVFAGDASPREAHHWRFPLVGNHGWCGEYVPQSPDQMSSTGVIS